MKQISIKTVDGARFDLPPRNDDLDVTVRYGFPEIYFIKLSAEGVTRYINCNHVVCITEREEQNVDYSKR